MKQRLTVAVAACAIVLVAAGAAVGAISIRVAPSAQGLANSTKSGNWARFDMSTRGTVEETFVNLGQPLSFGDAKCLSFHYRATLQPLYFALGVGVGGPNGVLQHNNPNATVLGDLKGIDELTHSPIGIALFGAAEACGIPLEL